MTPDFSRSTQTLALMDLLRAAPIGNVITYRALSNAIGEDIQGGARRYLLSAVKALFADGLAFGTVRKQGVKRLTSAEIPAIGDAALLHIGRTSRRARRRMGVISSMNDVPNAVRIKVNASASLLGAIETFAGRKSRAEAERQTEKVGAVIPPMKLLEALKE
jgi:hypothetical protein